MYHYLIKMKIPQGAAVTFLLYVCFHVHLRKMHIPEMCIRMFIATLFVIAKNAKNPSV